MIEASLQMRWPFTSGESCLATVTTSFNIGIHNVSSQLKTKPCAVMCVCVLCIHMYVYNTRDVCMYVREHNVPHILYPKQ